MRHYKESTAQSEARPSHAEVPQEKRAAEYLANERTFLAWIRTSIAVVSIGFAVTRLGPKSSAVDLRLTLGSSGSSLIMGVVLMAFGALVAVLAVWRYHVVNRGIQRGQVKADRGLVILVTFLVVFISAGAIVYTLFVE